MNSFIILGIEVLKMVLSLFEVLHVILEEETKIL